MRLKKGQKEAVLKWIAEGLLSDEINDRASEFIPPFSVSPSQVTYYRNTRAADIAALIKAGEQDALTEGLATRGERVKKLKSLAALLERDLFGGFLWLEQVKGVGSGDIAQIVEYEEFNKGEVDAYRGVLDDIAKEVGDRTQRLEHTGAGGGPIVVVNWDDDSSDTA
jgi:hypothetical protein